MVRAEANVKVVIIGASLVSRRRLVARYCAGADIDDAAAVVGGAAATECEQSVKTMAVDGDVCNVWVSSVAGSAVRRVAEYRAAHIVIFLYDVHDRVSFEEIFWTHLNEAEMHTDGTRLTRRYMIGVRDSSSSDKRQVYREHAEHCARNAHLEFREIDAAFDCSALLDAAVRGVLQTRRTQCFFDAPPLMQRAGGDKVAVGNKLSDAWSALIGDKAARKAPPPPRARVATGETCALQ